MERLPKSQRFLQLFGAASLLLSVEACKQEPPQEQTVRGFVSALADGNLDRASSFFAPDIRNHPGLRQSPILNTLSQQLKGCQIDTAVVRQNPLGALIGSAEQVSVTFKQACGSGTVKFGAIVIGIDRAGEKYFVNPLVIIPMPTSR